MLDSRILDNLSDYVTYCKMEYCNTGKIPLVLFSGGLDSTFLLYSLLDVVPVDILYVDGCQGVSKATAELKAREKIIRLLESRGDLRLSCTFKVRNQIIANHGNEVIAEYRFAQVLPWIYGAISNYTREHSSVAISYVLGDDICGDLKDVRTAWDLISNFTKQHPVPLAFPLRRIRKTDIYKILPEKLLKLVWVCENPNEIKRAGRGTVFKPCGKCVPCITQKVTEYRLELMA